MTNLANAAHLPSLGAHQRAQVGDELQATLIDLIDLSLVGKQLHWNVVGSNFRSLHLQLDELVDAWRELGDTVAERAVAIGFAPDGQAAAVAAGGLGQVAPGPIQDTAVVRDLSRRLADVAERTRERLVTVGEIDLASQDVLIDAVRALEQQLWMIRVQAA